MAKKVVTAAAAKRAAKLFDYGNLVAILAPVLIPLWFGVSMFVYAMNRHHPNPRVGYHTQWAAYRFYGLTGLVIPVATYFPVDIRYYLVLWAVMAAILVPWTLYALWRIDKEEWHDIEYDDAPHEVSWHE